jgi:hypothetical protein
MSKDKKSNVKNRRTYVSEPIELNINKLENKFSRADIEIHNVDHRGASYEGRVFLNNPDADENTKLSQQNGYAGSYHIFGHGGCVGNLGHCDLLPTRPPYDKRPTQDLRPQYKRIIITDMLRKLGKRTSKFTITVVPVLFGKHIAESKVKDILKFERIGIITYDGP